MAQEQLIFKRSKALTDANFHYCPGCTHGIAHRLIAEVIEEMGIQDRTIGVCPVGCSVMAYNYFDVDMHEASHGRAPAVATGIRRTLPEDRYVFTYQGDGDLASIGMGEIVHAANRGEKFTTIFVNNAIYGMTGGQMAPTTLVGQYATTSPKGRDPVGAGQGYPIKVCELLSSLGGTKYLARGSVDTPVNIKKTKKMIRTAFEAQMRGEGFTLVEILSQCPTNWKVSPHDSIDWLQQNMIPFYPLGEIKNTLTTADQPAGTAK